MPPSLDKPGVRLGGISEACGYNDHTDCRVMGCECDCHVKAEKQAVSDIPVPAGPEKACPKCGVKRPFTEVYCRIDGERLVSLLCGMCGAGMEPNDNFCWQCSGPKGAKREITEDGANLPNSRVVPAIQDVDEVDDGQRILRELQRELGEQGEESDRPQEVVEQPAGTQGSFKIVSKPNPNKLRTGASVGVPGPGPSTSPQTGAVPSGKPATPSAKPFRLPIKPS